MSVLFIHSHYGPTPAIFAELQRQGRITIIRDSQLSDAHIASARGIITTQHLDQVKFASHREAIAAFLFRNGRLFFNGHILKPFLSGLEPYRPMLSRHLTDLQLVQLDAHPVFGGIDQKDMTTRKGVAGFYGRGHNPLPRGARAVTGIGPLKLPVDWEWTLPTGGRIFAHAGNDLWSMAPGGPEAVTAMADRILRWTAAEPMEAAA